MDWSLLPIFVLACLAAASSGAMFSPDQWYRDLSKPPWTPPDWVFPVTWTVLYICMAVAAARAATVPGNEMALAFWALQMVVNVLWSPIFFGLKKIQAGMVAVLALWLAVAATMISLFQLDWIAGALFVPYLVWVTIAAALNYAVMRRNPESAAT